MVVPTATVVPVNGKLGSTLPMFMPFERSLAQLEQQNALAEVEPALGDGTREEVNHFGATYARHQGCLPRYAVIA
jgi:hypothetical protein